MQAAADIIPDAPVWFEGLKWAVLAILLALAIAGPVIFRPFLNAFKQAVQVPQTEPVGRQMAVIGGALADRDSVLQLTLALNRLCTILEKRYEEEQEISEEEKMRRIIKELLREHHHT